MRSVIVPRCIMNNRGHCSGSRENCACRGHGSLSPDG